MMLVTGCNAGQFPSNTVTITANPIGTLDANFSVTASAPTGSPTFTVSATAAKNGSIWFFWEVSEINLNTGLVVPGTTLSAGIYFIQFTVNGQLVQPEKIVVVK